MNRVGTILLLLFLSIVALIMVFLDGMGIINWM